MEESKKKMDKIQPPRRPILGGTKNGVRPQRYSYWRTGYAKLVPHDLDFWVKQAGEYHTDKPFFSDQLEHSEVDQFYYHLEGDGQVAYNTGVYKLSAGDLIIIPKGAQYTYETTSGAQLHWFGLSGSTRLLDRFDGVTRLSVGRNPLIETTFILMREVLILDRPGSALRAVSLVYELYSLIEQLEASAVDRDTAIYPDTVRIALSYMRENYIEPFSAEQVAQTCGVTASHLRALFQKWVGESPQKTHTRFRIEMAEKLLVDQHLSVAEVAHQIGYSDPYYFSRVFKKMTGHRPSRYRLIFGENEPKQSP